MIDREGLNYIEKTVCDLWDKVERDYGAAEKLYDHADNLADIAMQLIDILNFFIPEDDAEEE